MAPRQVLDPTNAITPSTTYVSILPDYCTMYTVQTACLNPVLPASLPSPFRHPIFGPLPRFRSLSDRRPIQYQLGLVLMLVFLSVQTARPHHLQVKSTRHEERGTRTGVA